MVLTTHSNTQDARTQLTLVTDRSHGGSSLASGQMEIMVTFANFWFTLVRIHSQLHRRMFEDDHFGVGEALNEKGPTGQGRSLHRAAVASS